MTNGDAAGCNIPPAREGQRRRFSADDKRTILLETEQPGASLSEVARRYGIAPRMLFRWKQELMPASTGFVTVQVVDEPAAEVAP